METDALYLGAIGIALPPCRIEQEEAARLIALHYEKELRPRSKEMIAKVLSHPSIRSRYFAIDKKEDIVALKNEDPDRRIARFTRWAKDLAVTAAQNAMAKAAMAPSEISVIVVNTCTGYICPGISTYCLEPLGLRPDVWAFDMVGSGCGGALPNMQMGEALLRKRGGGAALCISVEICSATFQMDNDPSLLISNAIFGDGAAAALLWDRPRGPRLAAFASRYAPENRDDVRYVYKRGQLFNRITPQLPGIIRRRVPPFIRDFLKSQNHGPADVDAWALHPGGDRIVNGLQEELFLTDSQIEPTRGVLRDAGNMSSPTVLFVLERVLAGPGTIGRCCLCSYGAGLSMHACLLECLSEASTHFA